MSALTNLGATEPFKLDRLFVFPSLSGNHLVGDGAKMVGDGYEVLDAVVKAQFARSLGFIQLDADKLGTGVVDEGADFQRALVAEFDDFHDTPSSAESLRNRAARDSQGAGDHA